MIKIDNKQGIFEVGGNPIDVITDIGFAIFKVTCAMTHSSKTNWIENLERLMNSIEGAVKAAYMEEKNDTFG